MTELACQRCNNLLEPGDLRCAVCALGVAAPDEQPIERPHADILRCPRCGAAVTYKLEVQAPSCAFCGSVLQVERPIDPVEEAAAYLPFFVQPASAERALANWLARQVGFYTPAELSKRAVLAGLQPIWFVAWITDATAAVSWTADGDAGTNRAPWAPQSGNAMLRFDSLLVPASRGLSFDECAKLAPSFQPASAEPLPNGPLNATIERFAVQRSFARYHVTSEIERSAASQLVRGYIAGDHFRNVRVSAMLTSLRTRRYALPAYVLAYRYQGELYRAIVSGQDERAVFGSLPKTYRRLVFTIVLIVVALVLFVAWLLSTSVGMMMLVSIGGRCATHACHASANELSPPIE